jgi:hypothetical protein
LKLHCSRGKKGNCLKWIFWQIPRHRGMHSEIRIPQAEVKLNEFHSIYKNNRILH